MPDTDTLLIARRHQLFGWWSLFAFLSVGIVLETMHGFKIGWYLDTGNETRRLMWTLAHAHGTLIGLIQVAFAAAVSSHPDWGGKGRLWASRCLIWGGILMPLGFLLGGVVIYEGDPGLPIFLVPPSAFLVMAGVGLAALGVQRSSVRPG